MKKCKHKRSMAKGCPIYGEIWHMAEGLLANHIAPYSHNAAWGGGKSLLGFQLYYSLPFFFFFFVLYINEPKKRQKKLRRKNIENNLFGELRMWGGAKIIWPPHWLQVRTLSLATAGLTSLQWSMRNKHTVGILQCVQWFRGQRGQLLEQGN